MNIVCYFEIKYTVKPHGLFFIPMEINLNTLILFKKKEERKKKKEREEKKRKKKI